jgi:hypothetical protein
MANIDLNKLETDIQRIADELDIDLSMYGNASPTRLLIESLKLGVRNIMDIMLLLNNEQNPLTATHFKSKLGLASILSINNASMLSASEGKVIVDPIGKKIKKSRKLPQK